MTEKKQHPHAEFLRAIADGETLDDWNFRHTNWSESAWLSVEDVKLNSIVLDPKDWQVRRKQKTIRIGAMEVPEPMRVAPANGTLVWLADPFECSPVSGTWDGGSAGGAG